MFPHLIPRLEYHWAPQFSTGHYVVFRIGGSTATPSYETIATGLDQDAAYKLATRLNVQAFQERSPVAP